MSRRSRRNSGRVTLDDVARHVGVSKITISRALRQPDKVSAPLKTKIEHAIELLGYIPNRQAGSLASARSHAIALIVPSLSNGVFSEVLRGVDEVFQQSGYQVLLGHSGYSIHEEERLVNTYLSYGVEGFIVSSGQHTERTLALLKRSGLPVVEMMGIPKAPLDMAVGLDHEAAGHAITSALIELGYRNIGFGGARMDFRAQERLNGWRRALREHGLDDTACLTTFSPSTYHLGGALLNDIVGRFPATEAIFFCNDDLAAGALFECQRQGLRVPTDMAVAGFNGMDITDVVSPRLTTVVTPRRPIGERAAQLLLKRLNAEPVEARVVDLGFTLALRDSTSIERA
ncbi:LacI family DNA-binding transcriptional regulator [Larsenimonas suaedae]|uniref:LacI family DNA-binding transcriptional regulator n=1 Tax=Larsenimonas suaedae TaxID=1851019 RepID=A0ABU1GVU1_9GAMM|nr:LacI family DNA-binding transcriptional regulator [Larsenimonas suaedae]MCM2972005.1 LacI family DNA-binding transcriptional regulator [Larsenimonas suaedae]MDR5895557.1 LacI family DNA-binding transcriptional regulator [Larsenimonas suaedae]